MKVLGIDPGIAILGVSIIEDGRAIFYDSIETDKDLKKEQRLLKIYKDLKSIIKKHSPQHIAVEKLYFNKNVTTAMIVSEARGVVLLLAAEFNLKLFEYTPLQIKQSICAYGKATKKDVEFMVQKLLNIEKMPKRDDVVDALAIALTHYHLLENNYDIL